MNQRDQSSVETLVWPSKFCLFYKTLPLSPASKPWAVFLFYWRGNTVVKTKWNNFSSVLCSSRPTFPFTQLCRGEHSISWKLLTFEALWQHQNRKTRRAAQNVSHLKSPLENSRADTWKWLFVYDWCVYAPMSVPVKHLLCSVCLGAYVFLLCVESKNPPTFGLLTCWQANVWLWAFLRLHLIGSLQGTPPLPCIPYCHRLLHPSMPVSLNHTHIFSHTHRLYKTHSHESNASEYIRYRLHASEETCSSGAIQITEMCSGVPPGSLCANDPLPLCYNTSSTRYDNIMDYRPCNSRGSRENNTVMYGDCRG